MKGLCVSHALKIEGRLECGEEPFCDLGLDVATHSAPAEEIVTFREMLCNGEHKGRVEHGECHIQVGSY